MFVCFFVVGHLPSAEYFLLLDSVSASKTQKWCVELTFKVTYKDIYDMKTEKGSFKPEVEICEDNETVQICSVCAQDFHLADRTHDISPHLSSPLSFMLFCIHREHAQRFYGILCQTFIVDQ